MEVAETAEDHLETAEASQKGNLTALETPELSPSRADQESISPSRAGSDTMKVVQENIKTDWARGSEEIADLEKIDKALEKTNYHGGLTRKLLLEQRDFRVHSEELRKLTVG